MLMPFPVYSCCRLSGVMSSKGGRRDTRPFCSSADWGPFLMRRQEKLMLDKLRKLLLAVMLLVSKTFMWVQHIHHR